MSDEGISVKIGADASGVQAGASAAKAAISDMSAQGKADAAALNAEFVKLNATLVAMQGQIQQTAEATGALKSYADWGFALNLVKMGYEGVAGAASLVVASAVGAKNAVLGVEQGAESATRSWQAYAESLAYVDNSHLHVRQSGEGLTAAYGRMSIALKEWLQEFSLFRSATVGGELNALAFSGSLNKLNEQLGSIGFTTASAALSDFTTVLMRVPGMTEQMAAQIQNAFARIPGYSAPLNQELVDLVTLFSDSASEAQDWSKQLTSAMSDPLNTGKQFLDTLGGVESGVYAQLASARESSNVYAAQSLLLGVLADKAKNLAEAQKQRVVDSEKDWAQWGLIGRAISTASEYITGSVQKTNELLRTTQQVVAENKGAGNAIREQVAGWDEVHKKLQAVLATEGTYSTQLDALHAKMKTVQDATGGGSSGGSVGSWWTPERQSQSIDYLMQKANLSPMGAAGLTARWAGVEAGKGPSSVNPDSGAIGIGQWLGERQNGISSNSSFEDQLQHAVSELNFSESPAADALRRAKTPEEAARGASMFERAEGYDKATGTDNFTGKTPVSQVYQTKFGGEASPATAQETQHATELTKKLVDEELQLNDAKAGGSAIDKQRIANLERQITGDRDEVAAQERVVAAAQRRYAQAQAAGASESVVAARGADLAREKLALDEKQFAVKKASAAYDVAAAAGDSVETFKAKQAQAKLVMDRYQGAPQSPEYQGAKTQSEAAQTEFDKSNNAAAQADANERYKVALKELELKKGLIREELDLRKISSSEAMAQDLAIDDERVTIEKHYLEMVKNIYGEDADEYAKAQHKMSETLTAEAVRRQRDVTDAAKKSQQVWDQMTSSMSGSMSSTVMGLITHTEKFSAAERKMATDIVGSFIKMGTDMVASFAMAVLKNVATHALGETTMTAATDAGVAARVGAQAAGMTSGMALQAAAILKNILAYAAEAGAGAAAEVAPLSGPAAVGIGASVMAGVAGFRSIVGFDVGAYDIPHDQLAMVHKNELIMTASQGEAFRNVLSNASGENRGSAPPVSVSAPLTINALDSRSVSRVLNSNNRALMKSVERATRMGAHLGMQGF